MSHAIAEPPRLSRSNPADAAELIRKTATPACFARSVSRGRWIMAPHLRIIDEAVIDTINGRDGCRRLVIQVPPRHGKSELCSRYMPCWFCGTYPDRRVTVCGYGASFASEWGRKARDLMHEWGPTIFGKEVRSDSKSADNWGIE